jgi:Ca2+-binding EF-hand superfamily protein
MSFFQLDSLFSKLDQDNSGTMSFQEFMVPSIEPLATLNSNDKMWIAYKDMEVDNRGSLSMRDVEAVLSPKHEIKEYIWR